MDLERAFSKLRYDDSVLGYALVTNEGQPFLSFSLPEDTLPTIQATLAIHSSSMTLMNVMTEAGIAILARIDANWLLVALFSGEMSLGIALQKVKDVAKLLEQVTLPPPPALERPVRVVTVEKDEPKTEATQEAVAETAESAAIIDEDALEDVVLGPGCVIHKGKRYTEASAIESEDYSTLKDLFQNTGIDVLLLIDEQRTVSKIAEMLAKPIEQVLDVIKWSVSRQIVLVECPSDQHAGQLEIVEVPIYEGEIKKVKKQHRRVVKMCDGTLTVQEIADQLNIPYFTALQSLVPYRGKGLNFIQKNIQKSEE